MPVLPPLLDSTSVVGETRLESLSVSGVTGGCIDAAPAAAAAAAAAIPRGCDDDGCEAGLP